MELKRLGATELLVSPLAFGAGPIPSLMTAADRGRQTDVVRRAVDTGVNWFDTAATYGDGASERSLGLAIRELGVADRVHVATKVRILPGEVHDIPAAIERSIEGSLERLGLESVTLLQLHNSVTAKRGDEPTSLSPGDVLGEVLEVFRQLQRQGKTRLLGLTGIGHAEALRAVVTSGAFDTIQIPFNLANPTAGFSAPVTYAEADYGNVIADCSAHDMGVFAIRVYAGGALLDLPPADHTYKTRFFPLDLYQRDVQLGKRLRRSLGELSVAEAALRFTLSHPQVASAIVGFSLTEHVDQAVQFQDHGALPSELIDELLRQIWR